MAVNPSWRATRLSLANILVYAVVALLVAGFGPALRFAVTRLPGYFRGDIGSPEHWRWENRAEDLLEENRDLDAARNLLERAIAAEPNGSSHFLLGEVLRAQGRTPEALRHYEISREIDPTRADTYVRIAELLDQRAERPEAIRVLEDGSTTLERLVRLEVPVPDPVVDPDYNQKAVEVHSALREGLAVLREELRRRHDAGAPATPRGTGPAHPMEPSR